MADSEQSEDGRGIRQEATSDQKETESKRDESPKNNEIEKIAAAIRDIKQEISSQGDESHPRYQSEMWWKRREVIGLWAAAAVGLIAIVVASHDSREQIGVLKSQVASMQEQLNEARDALVAQQRAWIGVSLVSLNNLILGEGVTGRYLYGNTGREPAEANSSQTQRTFTKQEWSDGSALTEINSYPEVCKSTGINGQRIIIYPSPTPAYGGTFDTSGFIPETHRVFVTNDLIKGNIIFVINFCFAYRTQKELHHSNTCFYYSASENLGLQALALCKGGNYAD